MLEEFISKNENFVNNKYRKWYMNIIQKRIDNPPEGYSELHHIVPKSINKDLQNNKLNLVTLTAKEHFICHLLLTKFTKGTDRRNMCFAVTRMASRCKNHQRIFTSGYYELARKHYVESALGRRHSQETKEKISKANMGRVSPNKGNKFGGARTEEAKLKISKAKTGIKLSEDHRKKLSAVKIGKKRGNYKKHKEYKMETCSYCGIFSIPTNITRWHNTNCKVRTLQCFDV